MELGPGLAAVARRKLAAFPAVDVVEAAFESWPLPPEPFDLVLAATSFHWIDPAVRAVKAAAALRPGGALAVVSTHHVAGGSRNSSHSCRRAKSSGCRARRRACDSNPPPPCRGTRTSSCAAGCSRAPSRAATEWELGHATQEYLDLLRSYSSHRALTPDARNGLFACISRLMD